MNLSKKTEMDVQTWSTDCGCQEGREWAGSLGLADTNCYV